MRTAGLALLLVALLAPAADARLQVERVLDDDALGFAPKEWGGKPLSLADVDGDGRLDVVAQNADRRVYAIDARGDVLFAATPSYPYGPDLGPFNAARAADLDGDGDVEIVSVDRAAVLTVWSAEDADEPLWERHLDAYHGHPSADAGPVLADLDADGALDIVAQTEERGLFAYRADGTLLWSVDHYGGNAEPVARDVDADGDLDVVAFTDGGVAYAVDGPTGAQLWRFESRRHGAWPASITAPGVVDDLDGDGRVEVVFCARNLEDATPERLPEPLSRHHLMLFAIRDGELLWKAKPSWANPLCAAQPIAHDVDGDGRKEILGMDWNTVGHKPGEWERLPRTHAFAFDADGSELWHATLDPYNAKANVALADATGDGRADLLAYDADGLAVLDARDGHRVGGLDLGAWRVKQGPVVADLDGDGDAEAIVAVDGRSHALLVVSLDAALVPDAWPGWSAPARPARLAAAPAAPSSEPVETTAGGGPPGPTSLPVDQGAPAPERRETPATSALPLLVVLLVAASKRFSRGHR